MEWTDLQGTTPKDVRGDLSIHRLRTNVLYGSLL